MTVKDHYELDTSALSRFFRIAGLVGRVASSTAAAAILNVLGSDKPREEIRVENIVKNMSRIAETLGSLKGGVMKIGQMMSLHEGLLPPEAVEILRSLQREAPPVAFPAIVTQIKNSLKDRYNLIKQIEQRAYASASIGQVHRAILHDGSQVVLKVQYPGIDRVVAADMKNLKGLMKLIFSMFSQMDMEPIWTEVNKRLREELDYENEASNMEKLADLYASDPKIIIPRVFRDVSSRRVLCMSFEEGIAPDVACSESQPQELRDQWGRAIFEMLLQGIFSHRVLHADPNLSNFSFRSDGKIIVYDFGCVKEVPLDFAKGYAGVIRAAIEKRYKDVPRELQQIGIQKTDGSPVPEEVVKSYAEILIEPFCRGELYTFGQDNSIYDKFIELGKHYWQESMNIEFPGDIIFINRSVFGHFGNLNRMKATGKWGDLLSQYIS